MNHNMAVEGSFYTAVRQKAMSKRLRWAMGAPGELVTSPCDGISFWRIRPLRVSCICTEDTFERMGSLRII